MDVALDEHSEPRLKKLYMDLNMSNESLALNVFMYLCCAEDGKKETNFNRNQPADKSEVWNAKKNPSNSIAVLNQRDAELSLPATTVAPLKNSFGTA